MFHNLTSMTLGRTFATVFVCAAMAMPAMAGAPAIVTFEDPPVPLGTTYGNGDITTEGDIVLVEDDIAMAMRLFVLPSGANFNVATVGGRFDDYFPTTPLELNNISAGFELDGLPFDVTQVTIEYLTKGGQNVVVVNNDGKHVVDDMTDLPNEVAPGVTVTVVPQVLDPPDGWIPGLLTFTAAEGVFIHSVKIGGQELGIDNVTAIPEPATLALIGLGAAAVLRRRRKTA